MARRDFRSSTVDRHALAQRLLYAPPGGSTLHLEMTDMNARKQYGGGFAVLLSLAVVAAAVVLPSCGGGDDGPNCTSNPAGPGCPPPPTTLPATVTRIVSQGNDSLESKTLGFVVFNTTTTGTLGVEVNWTFATNDIDIALVRGNDPCDEEALINGTCNFIATEESPTMKPERLTVPNLPAGTYTLYIVNFGDTDESVAWQVTLTSTSASSASSATTANVRRGAAKGTLHRTVELR